MIGYLVSDISNYQFTLVSRTIEDAIEGEGYSLIVCSNDSQGLRELNSFKALLSHRIDGLIINTTGKNNSYIAKISEFMPVVLLYRDIAGSRFMGDFVGSSNHEGGEVMAETLLAEGHRRIGLIGGDFAINTFQERSQGFLARLAQEGIVIPHEYIQSGDYTEAGGYTMMGALLRQNPRLSAVCILNNAMAVGAYGYLREHNIPVPQSISVVSFGDISNERLFYVKPTFISQNLPAVGSKAAELILSRIKNPGLAPRREIINIRLNPGDSVGFPE
jgi:LacI family transcriptional regulator